MAPHVAVNEFDSSNSAPLWAPSESSSDVVTSHLFPWYPFGVNPVGQLETPVIEGSYPFKSVVAVIFTGKIRLPSIISGRFQT